MKKILSAVNVFLSVLFAASVSINAFASYQLPDYEPYNSCNGFTYKVRSDNTVVINGYTEYERNIVIPDTIEGRPVVRIGSEAFSGKVMDSVVIPEGVAEIGENAFSGCVSVNDVHLPASLRVIEEGAFRFNYGIDNLYYNGSKEQWNSIQIAEGNTWLQDAHIYYNYDKETYGKTTLRNALILCGTATLVPVVVIIILLCRRKKHCPDCGTELEQDSKFCGNCGREL